MTEQWRDIAGFEGLYEVSDRGRVRSVGRSVTDMSGRRTRQFKARIIQPHTGTGYKQVKLRAGGQRRGAAVHVLVAETFIAPAPGGASIRHINGDNMDNRVENLEYTAALPVADLPGETWRPVVGFEEYYEVSDLGRVRSLPRTWMTGFGERTKPMTMMRPGPGKNGYLTLMFKVEGRRVPRTVHSLVAEAFIGPRPPKHDVCHCNGIKTDNRAVNLRYDTRTGNALDTVKHGHHAGANKTHCVHGHEYTPENTIQRAVDGGRRRCKTCVREQARRNARRRRAEKNSN